MRARSTSSRPTPRLGEIRKVLTKTPPQTPGGRARPVLPAVVRARSASSELRVDRQRSHGSRQPEGLVREDLLNKNRCILCSPTSMGRHDQQRQLLGVNWRSGAHNGKVTPVVDC
jgi:hypothetical protein